MQKIIFIVLALLILSSCGADETVSEPVNPSVPSSSPVLPSGAPAGEDSLTGNSAADINKQPETSDGTITLMYYGGETESDALSESVLKRFDLNVRLNPYPSDYAGLLSVINSGSADMFLAVLSPSRLAEITASGYVRNIPDSFIEANANLYTYIQNNSLAKANRQIFNAYAYIPCDYDRNPAYAADSARFFYRKDWAKTLGLAEPQNPGDLYTMAKAFGAQQNPNLSDGTGLIGLAADSPEYFAALYGYDLTGWVNEDGRYIPAYYSDGILPMLSYLRRMYEEGLLKFTGDDDISINLNNAGILIYPVENAETLSNIIEPVAEQFDISTEEALEGHVGIIEPPRDPAVLKTWENNYRPEGWMISRNVSDDTLKQLLAFLDYTLTDEARITSRYGLSGVTYTQNANGIFMFTDPETYSAYNLQEMYPTGGFLNLLINDAGRESDKNFPSVIPYPVRRIWDETAQKYFAPMQFEDTVCRSVNSPLRDGLAVDYNESFYAIITGNEPVEVMFEQYKDTCRQAGIEAAVEEVNSAVNAVNK